MSDSRWRDVEDDLETAIRHFEMAVAIEKSEHFGKPDFDGYVMVMALMHAMQCGYTSAEAAFLKFLAMLGEDPPVGADWHKTLLKRLSVAREDDLSRPPVIDRETLRELEIVRGFRHRAMHAYEDFDQDLALPAMKAAARLPELLRRTFERISGWD